MAVHQAARISTYRTMPRSAASPGAQSVVEEHTIPYLPDALKQRQANYEKRETADTEDGEVQSARGPAHHLCSQSALPDLPEAEGRQDYGAL
jgi:hypothetical protein